MMQNTILRARQRAHEDLDSVARVLKRYDGIARRAIPAIDNALETGDLTGLAETRDAMRSLRSGARDALACVRSAQAGTLGITVETAHPEGEHERTGNQS